MPTASFFFSAQKATPSDTASLKLWSPSLNITAHCLLEQQKALRCSPRGKGPTEGAQDEGHCDLGHRIEHHHKPHAKDAPELPLPPPRRQWRAFSG